MKTLPRALLAAVLALLAPLAHAQPAQPTGAVTLPAGFTLREDDTFGSDRNVGSMAALHARFYEGQFFNRSDDGTVKLPNVVINHEQQTYRHFEDVVTFAADHLSINVAGQPDAAIWSAELVTRLTGLKSWYAEARYRIPAVPAAWAAFWAYSSASAPDDGSEVDFEQPIVVAGQGVHDIAMHQGPDPPAASVVIGDRHFTTRYMTYSNPAFDAAAEPHVYGMLYDDDAHTMTRFVDGIQIYTASWTWTSTSPACFILNVAVGGDWGTRSGTLTNDIAQPFSAYAARMDIYHLRIWGK